MNSDNMLLKIVTVFNEGVFTDSNSALNVSPMVNDILSLGGYHVEDCKFKVKNLFGNLDMCFIYGNINEERDSKCYEVINVDDSRGTRIMIVIFVNNLLNLLRKIKPNDEYRHCYKIFDGSNNFLGYASKYKIVDNKVQIREEDFDRKLPKNRTYQIPTNAKYLNTLIEIFNCVINMIRPTAPVNTITGMIYARAAIPMALFSHKVTIGNVAYEDFPSEAKIVDMVNDNDLIDILDGLILKVYKVK